MQQKFQIKIQLIFTYQPIDLLIHLRFCVYVWNCLNSDTGKTAAYLFYNNMIG